MSFLRDLQHIGAAMDPKVRSIEQDVIPLLPSVNLC